VHRDYYFRLLKTGFDFIWFGMQHKFNIFLNQLIQKMQDAKIAARKTMPTYPPIRE
jgi:hypothetical protein